MTDIDTPAPTRRAVLAERYRPSSGPVLLTGVQAIARLLIEQHSRDRGLGRHVATFVSGYQGSPLAGLDQLLASLPELAHHDIHLSPGVNEELAATAVWGSQLELPTGTGKYDGVVGVWYGKGPGLDRASDALRHAAMYGANPAGGAIALVGDDPAAKSSSVPAASERSLAALSMPVFFPRNAEEVVSFGLLGLALSRASGCWPAMKIVADVADGLWVLDRDFADFSIHIPSLNWGGRPWDYQQRILAAPPDSLLAEADLYGPRWAMVEAFNAANDIDRIEIDPAHAWLGIVSVGTAYDAVRQALEELGLSEEGLERAGIRVMRVGMPYPLGSEKVRRLARGVDQILVVEDKLSFVELQVKDILYGAGAPQVVGKRGPSGDALVPANGELTGTRLIDPLRAVLRERVELPPARPPTLQLTVLPARRTAYFCSGCPHNRSTAVPEGSLAGGGIGCHTLVTMSGRTDSKVTALTQMGGEGAQWIGQTLFTDVDHIFQNVGDGTYFHSGQLAVQACVAAGVNITYKILFNSAVAMTGAQDVQAGLTVPELTHKLRADGVGRIIVCADDPRQYRGSSLPRGVDVWHRDRLDEAQRILRDIHGVTVLIYDQHCAADARRKRKRGQLPDRRTRVLINESVCEGCGDCGVKSNCLSVQPVDTELGRKTRIDQSTCNTDYTCLDGECPSFVTVELPSNPRAKAVGARPLPPEVDEPPVEPWTGVHNVFLAGIGGTGIVTVNQVLAMAALRAGLYVEGLDQTGLSQKAGPVTSHLRLSRTPIATSNRVSPGSADCVLAFDLLTAADANYANYGRSDRTVTVASTSKTPTGDMVYDGAVEYPSEESLLSRLAVRSSSLTTMDALACANRLFGSTTAANFLVVGAAYQAGALPIDAAAIEEAIAINGLAVETNQAAFRWGRAAVGAPDAFGAATAEPRAAQQNGACAPTQLFVHCTVSGDTRNLLERRAAALVTYQNDALATRLISLTQEVWNQERRVTERTDFSKVVIDGFFKLLAYKDEYEVARMLTDRAFVESVHHEFPDGAHLTYRLHPPVLKAMGRRKKIGFGPRTHVVLRVLAKGKRLRGTWLDPFGHTRMRRLERQLGTHYQALVTSLLPTLTADSYDAALTAASAIDIVRGYEDVKMRNIQRYIERLRELAIGTDDLVST